MDPAPEREAEPTEFHVIPEGRPDRPIRIPTVFARRQREITPTLREQLRAALLACQSDEASEAADVQPLIVQRPPAAGICKE